MAAITKTSRKILVEAHNRIFQEWLNNQTLPLFNHAVERRSKKWKALNSPVPFNKA